MKLRDLTDKLQALCHEGWSDSEVVIEMAGFGSSITSVKHFVGDDISIVYLGCEAKK